jgi:NAD dependent epimerase/dehydratase family enzyme
MSQPRIILAGGSGFIGQALARELRRRDYPVTILTRSPRTRTDGIAEIQWDGRNPGEWVKALDGAEAVVNLAGQNINCPHTSENLATITSSRVDSVCALAAALPRLSQPPRTWVQASAVGFYGDTGDRVCDETSPAGAGHLAGVCRQWEDALGSAPASGAVFRAPAENPQRTEYSPTESPDARARPAAPGAGALPRQVVLRIGFVLGREGGALPVLSKITKLFLGGAVGGGRQYISWIHLTDLIRMLVAAITEDLTGVYNAVGPEPVTNAEFMRELRRVYHRPWSPPAPEFAVRLGSRLMNSEASLALMSARCVPRRMLERGFKFEFGKLDAALRDLCR